MTRRPKASSWWVRLVAQPRKKRLNQLKKKPLTATNSTDVSKALQEVVKSFRKMDRLKRNANTRRLKKAQQAVGAKWRDDNGGASGAAYVFQRGPSSWAQTARLNASDAAAGAAFGVSVAIDVRSLMVGAWHDSSDRGAAYIYTQPSSVDANLSTVTADNGSISAYGGNFFQLPSV